jgi:hypothetical protein
MPLSIYKELDWFLPLSPTDIQIQLADTTVRSTRGILYSLLIRIRGAVVHADFFVLDMESTINMPLILGRPFLRSTKACVDMPNEIRFSFDGRNMTINFKLEKDKQYT